MEKGFLAIVLHAHLPFVRHPELVDSLEENWLYEAITDTYIPLLLLLDRLTQDRVDYRLTLSLTPTLASMLADPLLQSRYLHKLDRLIELGEKEVKRTLHQPEFYSLAIMHRDRMVRVRRAYTEQYGQDLVNAFKRLQDTGHVEIIASAATHGYLPLLSVNGAAVRAQVRVGIDYYEQVFGQRARGFWLPECGYFQGVDELLQAHGIRYTILETHGVTHASARPKYGVYAPIYCPSGVAAFGRDPESSKQVWSSKDGYPGDHDYREFYRDIAYDLELDYVSPYIHRDGIRSDTGFKYFRITGEDGPKEVYNPKLAEGKAHIHAENFVSRKEREINRLDALMDRRPIIVAPYDAELFGHWWFEGQRWLDHVIRKISRQSQKIQLVTLSEYLEAYPVNQVAVPSCSSWGNKGFHETWLNHSNDWIYPHLHHGAQVMEGLVNGHPQANGLTLRALRQALRELLVAQASDWAFMINSGAMAEYATRRTKIHLSRFNQLVRKIHGREIDDAWLSRIESQNTIFPRLDYRCFC